ncbi:hypothetical protein M1413_00130 [Patescibacteria group bacterium]|nr:hypothetical protein [Patescibacteria group bacterium]MCL5114606.1 hypothetical protein [Patescibacteria group bacterium]
MKQKSLIALFIAIILVEGATLLASAQQSPMPVTTNSSGQTKSGDLSMSQSSFQTPQDSVTFKANGGCIIFSGNGNQGCAPNGGSNRIGFGNNELNVFFPAPVTGQDIGFTIGTDGSVSTLISQAISGFGVWQEDGVYVSTSSMTAAQQSEILSCDTTDNIDCSGAVNAPYKGQSTPPPIGSYGYDYEKIFLDCQTLYGSGASSDGSGNCVDQYGRVIGQIIQYDNYAELVYQPMGGGVNIQAGTVMVNKNDFPIKGEWCGLYTDHLVYDCGGYNPNGAYQSCPAGYQRVDFGKYVIDGGTNDIHVCVKT